MSLLTLISLQCRYTDFLVNEILPSGEVVHLDNLRGPSRKAHVDRGSATKSEAPDLGSIEPRAPHEPIERPRQDEKILPQPPIPDPQISDITPQQTTKDAIPSTNDKAKIPPHQQEVQAVPSAEQKTYAPEEKQTTEGGAPTRRKETTILRQTDAGLVALGGQVRDTEKLGPLQQDEEVSQPKAHEPAPSSTADWQSYATPSSGFHVGRHCSRRSVADVI